MADEAQVLSQVARPPDRVVRTGPRDTDVYDVWVPPASPRGAPQDVTVALIHGGFWRQRYDRHHLAPLAAAFADEGYVVANLEYPRVGMPGGSWPEMGAALRAAVDAVLADRDLPKTVVVVGHSAGGHLALWLSGQDVDVAGVIGLAACASLREVDRLHLSNDAARDLLGSTPSDRPDLWMHADPSARPATVPVDLVSGTWDDIVPEPVAAAYLDTRTPDEEVRHHLVEGADHFDLIDPAHPAFAVLCAALQSRTAS